MSNCEKGNSSFSANGSECPPKEEINSTAHASFNCMIDESPKSIWQVSSTFYCTFH